jgi:KipI family sensor histidine kinase inhibitor
VNFRRAGQHALLVELDGLDDVMRVAAELRRRRVAGITEIVPAARTVLVVGVGLDALAEELPRWALPEARAFDGPVLEIPVTYDGPDLDAVLARTGLSRGELVALHTGTMLTCAFCGFTPGFGYLTGLPAALQVPRLATPRPSVPAGAVGLAGEFTGVYPRVSPGGWQIIGRTALPMWDASRDPPSTLVPGARVRFVERP